ncbi:MAG: tRNA pseudouridine(55) synthase TruB [Alphaproteobacteria bacterium]|nr:tRNA pseudouridine(55) synthase TruB [Alphaproteobacteria bacterium]
MASGFIILDKESGLFSRTAGGRIARMFGTKKFGHIGTLDPMASGVLPIAIGDATKMIPFIEDAISNEKEYLFDVVFGYETDTLDVTGHETMRSDIIPTIEMVKSVLPKLTGQIMQTPPQFSAVHVDGVRAYDAARRGRALEIPPRPVHIHELEFLGLDGDVWHFRTRCSRGTYVRSLGRDIAQLCGTFGTVSMIRRTQTNGFSLKNAVKLDFLENLFNNGGDFKKFLESIDSGLGDIPVTNLNDKDADFYRNGGFIKTCGPDGLTRVYCDKTFIGIGMITDGQLRPKRTI